MHTVLAPTSDRVEWIDIYKGIAIVLMVVGHATGMFNAYIYQFHMAAFLIVSGYTTSLEKRTLGQTIFSRFTRLLVPYFSVFFFLLAVHWVLLTTGLYSLFFPETMPFPGIKRALAEFFLYGNNFVYEMGGSWFVLVLFGTSIFSKLLDLISPDKWVYFLLSVALAVVGYGLVITNHPLSIFCFDFVLIFIANFYFAFGVLLRRTHFLDKFLVSKKIQINVILITLAAMWYMANVVGQRVDFPSKQFNFFLTDFFMGVNGSLMLVCFSMLATQLPLLFFRRLAAFFGRNTIGILFLHFLCFKVGYLPLYLLGIVPKEYFQNFLPSGETGSAYWPFIAMVSIFSSVVLWQLACKIPLVSILLGEQAPAGFFSKDFSAHLQKMGAFVGVGIRRFAAFLRSKITKLNVLVFSVCCIALAPLYNVGLTVNDELLYRYERMGGLANLFKWLVADRIRQKRTMLMMSAINITVGFPSTNDIVNGVCRIAILVCAIMLLGSFISLLSGNRYFGAVVSVSAAIFLPITFEHTAPSAFTTLLTLPLIYCLLSFIFFIKGLQNNRILLLAISWVLFGISLSSYEFMVTYVLLYPVLGYLVTQKNLKCTIRASIPFFAAAMVYMVLYFIMQSAANVSGYQGTEVGFTSLSSSLTILVNLALSCLPGYFLFNDKYEYISTVYNNQITLIDVLRCMFLVFLALFCIYRIFTKKGSSTHSKFFLLTAGISFLYMFIPSLPNSISQLYQNIVGPDQNFIAIPVSFFLFFAAVTMICSVLWFILLQFKNKKFVTIITVTVIGVLSLAVQWQSSMFANAHNATYAQLLQMEKLFSTQTVAALTGDIVSPDLYKSRNTLGFQDGYWSAYAQEQCNVAVDVLNTKALSSNEQYILYPANGTFFVLQGSSATILSTEPMHTPTSLTPFTLPDGSEGWLQYDIESSNDSIGTIDMGFYRYGANVLNFETIAENTFYGQYPDGWVGRNVLLKTRATEEGQVVIHGYYPYDTTGQETGTAFVAGTEYPYVITTGMFELSFPAPSNALVSILLYNNFLAPPGEDARELCFIIDSV